MAKKKKKKKKQRGSILARVISLEFVGRVLLVVGCLCCRLNLFLSIWKGEKNTEMRWRWRTVSGGGSVDGGSLLSFKQKDWFELSNS